MISIDEVTEIFFDTDEFWKVFEPAFIQRLLEEGKNTENVSLKVHSQKVKADRGCLSAFGTVPPIPDDLRTTSIQTSQQKI